MHPGGLACQERHRPSAGARAEQGGVDNGEGHRGRAERVVAEHPIAFVLGGGGVRGAVEIGMIDALLRADIRPDLVVGTSIGAINGALVASDPTLTVIEKLMTAWTSAEANAVYGGSLVTQISRLVKTKTHLNSPQPLRELLERNLGEDATFDARRDDLQWHGQALERA